MEVAKKHSKKRDAILAALCATREHPGADWLYARLKPDIPDLSLGTVYRNLALFKAEGLIQSVGTVNGQERFDGNPAPHAHFLCKHCGRVQDVERMDGGDALEAEAARVEETLHAAVTGWELTFYGLCDNCRTNGK